MAIQLLFNVFIIDSIASMINASMMVVIICNYATSLGWWDKKKAKKPPLGYMDIYYYGEKINREFR
jgi:hypothetical protein